MSASPPPPTSSFSCGICLIDDLDRAQHEAQMPCCYTATSTVKYCRDCIRMVCHFAEQNEQNVGKCPTCRQFISIECMGGSDRVIRAARRDSCVTCRQMRVIVDPVRRLCEKCSLGTRYLFNYECEGCHRRQRIPHPMFMYQATTDSFSSDTWACHQLCHAQTRWRIVASDARRVPSEHAPESWGTRGVWLSDVRRRRLAEIANGGARPAPDCQRTMMTTFWLVWVLCFLFSVSGNVELYGMRGPVVMLCLGAAVRAAQWQSATRPRRGVL